MKREKSCGAIIYRFVNDQLELFLIQHRCGHWGFPKGHMEKSEKELQTALREVKEECNLDINILPGFRTCVEYRPKVRSIKEVVYFVATDSGSSLPKPQLSEVSNLGWFSVDEALKQLTFNNDRNILQQAVDFILGKAVDFGADGCPDID